MSAGQSDCFRCLFSLKSNPDDDQGLAPSTCVDRTLDDAHLEGSGSLRN
jgi:hypothetical protein